MAWNIVVERVSDGKSMAEFDPISDTDELAGILRILRKPSMFGTREFRVVLTPAL